LEKLRREDMRTLAEAVIASWIALALATAAGADPTVSLVWFATTDSGTTSGSFIDAAEGDVLELDIIVSPDANGVSLGSLSIDIGAAGVVNTFYRSGVDGINDGVGPSSFFPSASATTAVIQLGFVSQVGCSAGALGNLLGPFCGDNIPALGSPIPGAFLGEHSPDVWGHLTASWAAGVSIANPFTIARVELVVMSEHASWLMLCAGAGFLGVLHWRRAKGRRCD
jgi:hypothetical protein